MSPSLLTRAVAAFVFACVLPSLAHANTINLTVGAGGVAGDYILGEVFTRYDLSGGQAVVDAAAINGLLAVALGTRSGADPEYYRSITNFGVLPAATSVGAGLYGASDLSIVLPSVFQYLIVGYDGQNGGSQVYYIGGLAAGDTINIVPMAYPNHGLPKNADCGGSSEPDCGHLKAGEYYEMTHLTFLNPGGTVPDGGMTLSLLGVAMAGMGLIARRVKK